MHESILTTASRLSDDALLARLKVLASRERDATVELVAHLAELQKRRGYLREGPGSLYEYCRDHLGLSEDAAYIRSAAARAVRRFPLILGMLADGSLSVTAVKLLRPVLTRENHRAVLAEAKHRSNREVKLIVARLNPRPDVPSSVRRLPDRAPIVAPPTLLREGEAPASSPPLPFPPPVDYPVIAPLSPAKYEFRFTGSEQTYDKLRLVKDLLGREVPDGDLDAIFNLGLTLILREAEKKKMAATAKPRRPRGTKEDSRDVPAHVARAVWKRDGIRCAFVGRNGRCKETRFLELHHIQPYGRRGPATVENISVRCRAHNVYESELVFGRFEPPVVRETPENYAVSGEIPPVSKRSHADIEPTVGRPPFPVVRMSP